MNLYGDSKLLHENLLILAGKDEAARARAATDLKVHVELAARELSLERFTKFENELYQCILNLVSSASMNDKVGGILAIRELVDCTSAAAESKVVKFAKALSTALSQASDCALIELIADALGHMARNSPVSHVDYLELELNRALEWLKGHKNSFYRRFSACTMLQQLAKNARTVFFARIHEFFDLIWTPIWDPREPIRLAASRALSACLAVLRERTYHLQWYCLIYDQLQDGLANGSEDFVHGSILVLIEVLRYTGDFMMPRFKETCRAIMALKDHKSRTVRSAIVSLLPSLATLSPDTFARAHMEESLQLLQKSARNAELRPQALLSLGKLCLAMGLHLVDRIDDLMNIVKEAFGTGTSKKSTKSPEILPEALVCISDMVQGLGQPFHSKVYPLLEPMLQSGLTAELIDTLSVICEHLPGQKLFIQARLLEEATKVLGGESKPAIPEPSYVYSWAKKGERPAKHPLFLSNDLSYNVDGVLGANVLIPTPSSLTRSGSHTNLLASASQGNVTFAGSVIHGSSSSLTTLNAQRASISGPKSASKSARGGLSASPAPPLSMSTPTSSTHKTIGGNMSSVASVSGALTVNTAAAKSAKKSSFFSLTNNPLMKSSTANKAAAAPTTIGLQAIGLGLGLRNEMDFVEASPSSAHEITLVSLRTMASLSIPAMHLLSIVQQSVLPYLVADDYLIRREAARATAKMISCLIRDCHRRGPTADSVEEIIGRLLEVTVSDTSVLVRLATLQALTREFDAYLARTHHVDTLMLLLADESFEIRSETLAMLGRLSALNPANILPAVRTHLLRLLSEMKNVEDTRQVEEAVRLLCNFMQCSKFHFLVKPFMSTVIEALPLHAYGDVRAITAALETIGELSMVLQNELVSYSDRLLPVIISHMFDSSSLKKQEVAISTLGKFAKSTGLVVRPYLQYPQLLPKALDLLCKDSSNKPLSLRMELLRMLGLLGALEPSRYSMIVSFLQQSKQNKRGNENDNSNNDAGEDGLNFVGNRADKKMLTNVSSLFPLPGSSVERDHQLHRPAANNYNPANTGSEDARERAESNLSFINAANNNNTGNNINTGTGAGEKEKSVRRGSALDQEDLVRSDHLLYGDNADAPSHFFMYELSVMKAHSEPPQEKMINAKHSPNSEEYFPRVALSTLVKILQDQTLSLHHSTATQTIVQIFCCLGVRCVPYLEHIFPYFFQIVRHSNAGIRESILQQISQLVAITGNYITPYLPQILEVLRANWEEHLEHVLAVVQQIALTTADSFSEYLPLLLPLLLSSMTIPRDITVPIYVANNAVLRPFEEVLLCLKVLRVALRPYLHLFVPKLCKKLNYLEEQLGIETVGVQVLVIQTLRHLITGSQGAVVEQCHVITSVLVHSLCRVMLKGFAASLPSNHEVFSESMLTLTILAQQIGHRMLKFDSLIARCSENRGIDTSILREVMAAIRSGQWDENFFTEQNLDDEYDVDSVSPLRDSQLFGLAKTPSKIDAMRVASATTPSLPPLGHPQSPYQGVAKLVLNQQALQRAWDVAQRSTASDWHEWLWRFNVDLLRESPSPTLRACAPLAQAYAPMAKELFHAAFVSCWHELSPPFQESLVKALQTAFKSSTIPPDILQALLNLAEFMEHDVEALPISLSILAELAQKGHAYAKALHYRELEFQTNPAGCFENLININKKLDQYEAAAGLMKVATQITRKFPELRGMYTVQESWLAKLGYWDEALQKYDEKLAQSPRDSRAIAGKMKCLEALGRWEEAVKLCEENLDAMRTESETQHTNTHTKAAVIGARAAWSLNEWSRMDTFVSQLPPENMDGSFMKAVLLVHAEKFGEAEEHLQATRLHLDKTISSLMAESYGRAYMPLIMVQQCAELEEIMEYKKFLQESGLVNALSVSNTNNNSSSNMVNMNLSGINGVAGGNTTAMNGSVSVSAVSALNAGAVNIFANSSSASQSLSIDVPSWTSNSHTQMGAHAQSLSAPSLAASLSSPSLSLSLSLATQQQQQQQQQQRQCSAISLSACENRNSAAPRRPNRHLSISQLLNRDDPPPSADLNSSTGGDTTTSSPRQLLLEEAQRRKQRLSEKWRRRIRGCASTGRAAIPYWKYLLNGRRMVLSEQEDLDTWLDFVSLCRNGGNSALAERVLSMSAHSSSLALDINCNSNNDSPNNNNNNNNNNEQTSTSIGLSYSSGGGISSHSFSDAPFSPAHRTAASLSTSEQAQLAMERRITFAVLKQVWAKGEKERALKGLEQLVRKTHSMLERSDATHGTPFTAYTPQNAHTLPGGLSPLLVGCGVPLNYSSSFPTSFPANSPTNSSCCGNATNTLDSSYLSCLLKLGEWKLAILDPSHSVSLSTRLEVLSLYARATCVDRNSYRAFHQWGLCNYRAIEEIRGWQHAQQCGAVASYSSTNTQTGAPTKLMSMSLNIQTPKKPVLSTQQRLAQLAHLTSQPTHAQSANLVGLGSPVSMALSSNSTSNGANSNVGYTVPSVVTKEQLISFAVNAIHGLMRALSLGTRRFSSSVMQDMLCVLSLWFRYGKHAEVARALEKGLEEVPIDNWLGVLPQLIARIDHPDHTTRSLLHALLVRLGAKHAQALVYPLSVALKSPKGERKEAAEALMSSLRQRSPPRLMDQALLVSQELVRVAISWEESWHWALEDASRQCFGEGDIQGMLNTLLPLHEEVEKGANTVREAMFVETFKYELKEALACLLSYQQKMRERGVAIPTSKEMQKVLGPMHEDALISQAWDLYYPIFKRINSQLPHVTALDMQSCSPALFAAKDLDLGVPGTYTVQGQAVRIKSFHSIISIIRSKQRPRKLRISGEDGREFVFLLKGHEDLRQDERAMQLFGLVNALLYYDRRTGGNSEDLQIQRYPVMPLSPTVGLIGWVPNCDTLHDLIRSYRDSRKIMLDVEHRLILQVAPGKLYDSLPAMHKLEVFEHAMAYTAGEDLAKILWLKSEHSEAWLQRRSTYTRSLAVMSMVGYILGLGDRHPSNLMLDRKTGKILHIDFGDCFEVAMHREKFPEKVPFRLTRMLVQAMEVAGIEGNFRHTCEKVMAVLRENRDSLVAMLEAFVHDPLISWRLMNINPKNARAEAADKEKSPEDSSAPTSPEKEKEKEKERDSRVTFTSPAQEKRPDISDDKNNSNGSNTDNEDVPPPPPPMLHDTRARSRSISKQVLPFSALEPIKEHVEEHTPEKERETETEREDEGEEDIVRLTVREKEKEKKLTVSPSALSLSLSLLSSSLAAANNGTQITSGTTPIPAPNITQPATAQLSPRPTDDLRFAEHSAATDVLSSSLSSARIRKREQDASPLVLSQSSSQRERESSRDTSPMPVLQHNHTGSGSSSSSSKVSASAKTVSFSLLNQTIDADNTIRSSSAAMAVVQPRPQRNERDCESEEEEEPRARSPAVPVPVPLLPPLEIDTANDTTTDSDANCEPSTVLSDVSQNLTTSNATTLDSTEGIAANTAVESDRVTASNTLFNRIHGSTGGGPVSVSMSASVLAPPASRGAAMHLELASLANSLSQSHTGRVLAASGRHSSLRVSSSLLLAPPSSSSVSASVAGATPFDGERDLQQEELTEKAVIVVRRVMDKLTGLDFAITSNGNSNQDAQAQQALEVKEQVDRLIREATSNEHLSQSFFGWCPFW